MTCLILAAGSSKRLGRPKARLPIAGEALLSRTVRVAREAGLRPLVIFGDLLWIEEAVGADWLQVSDATAGMGLTIAEGIAALPADTPRCVITPLDLPTLAPSHLAALMAVPTPVGASVLPDGRLGAPASFASACFSALLTLSGDRGARDLLRGGRWPVTPVTPPRPLIDIDTPADWAAFHPSQEAPCG